MPGIELRTLLDAFAMASGAPPVAWQATGTSQAAAAETGQTLPNIQSARKRKRGADQGSKSAARHGIPTPAMACPPHRKVRMEKRSFIRSSTIGTTTIRKLKIRLLPFLFELYVVAFLDRVNIGFAALTMNRELTITSQQFGLAAGIFFWGYFLFEIPSNLMLHKIGARIWITRILITWGVVATLTGFVQSANQLYIARFMLGLAEAGYWPGIVLYLGYWFRQREKAQALALILVGIPLASLLGSPISGLILDHVHWFGLSSWRWLFILEDCQP